MLAFRVSITYGIVTLEPKVKPFGPILSCDSAHPSHVHRNWPPAFARELRECCARPADAIPHIERFCARIESSFAPPWRSASVRSALPEDRPPRARAVSGSLLLPMDFHPALGGRFLPKALELFGRDPWKGMMYRDAFNSMAPTVRIAWRFRLPRIVEFAHRMVGGWGR